MAKHGRIYQSILEAVLNRRLPQPFGSADIERTCPGFARNTYKNFLAKHAKGNSNNATELFIRIERGKYCLDNAAILPDEMDQLYRETESSTPFGEMRDQYFELLKPLFLPDDPVSNDIIKYFASLLRVLGMEDGGWDPYAESRAILNDINGIFKLNLPQAIFSEPDWTTWRLGLLLYSHIVEMDAPYEVMANLLRFQLGKGYSPSPFYDFLTSNQKKSFRRVGISASKKIEIIKQLSESAGLNVGKIFDDFYDNRLRNAISHSDYILAEESFRCRGGISGARAFSITYEELNRILVSAKAFMSAFFSAEQLARQVWGAEKQRAIPYDSHYKGLMEVLVDDRDLMCGFAVHWPNNSQSTYRRTEHGIEMINCSLDLDNAAISLFVDLYARKPGSFSPLVEQGARPIYTNLDGCEESPTWLADDVDKT